MICKKLIILFITLFSPLCIYSYGGFDGWKEKTPYGNIIDNSNNTTRITLKNDKTICNINEWYFYKSFIIGNVIGDSKQNYFIVNEETMEVFYFDDKIEFEKSLNNWNLKPVLWKRSYSKNWLFFNYEWYLLYVLGFIVSIPVTIFFFFSVYIVVFVEKFDFRSPYTFLMSAFVIFLFIRYLLDIFPQSI